VVSASLGVHLQLSVRLSSICRSSTYDVASRTDEGINIMVATDFTLAGYRALVENLVGRGYLVVGYGEADPAARHLILRHDLDMSLEAALRIASIEAELAIKASYFVLLRTEMYNPWSKQGQKHLHRIMGFGHEIGLHLDCSLYPDDPDALDRAAIEECRTLEAVTGTSVKTVSFHRPAAQLLGWAEQIGGRRHTYQPRFYSDMGYCSDSRGAWRHGHPLDHPAMVEGRAVQLLTHPIWWNRAAPLDPVATLDRFRDERDGVLAAALSANCIPYRETRGATPSPLKRDDE